MCAEYGCHGVIRPLFTDGSVDEFKFVSIVLVRAAVVQTRAIRSLMSVLALDRPVPSQIHGNGRISPLGPQFCPFSKSRPAAAMNQHHGGQVHIEGRITHQGSRCGVVSEHTGGSAAERLALIEERTDGTRGVDPFERGRRT